jgi:hypothetical protein
MTVFQLPETTGPMLEYWIVCFPDYGTFVYYGAEKDAKEMFEKKQLWESGEGTMHRADPDNKKDRAEVCKEIQAVRDDREAGIKNLPFLPSKGWF